MREEKENILAEYLEMEEELNKFKGKGKSKGKPAGWMKSVGNILEQMQDEGKSKGKFPCKLGAKAVSASGSEEGEESEMEVEKSGDEEEIIQVQRKDLIFEGGEGKESK